RTNIRTSFTSSNGTIFQGEIDISSNSSDMSIVVDGLKKSAFCSLARYNILWEKERKRNKKKNSNECGESYSTRMSQTSRDKSTQ
ncbi:hypothetical protein L9F63_018092, partial [Diploptera punctata]